MDMVTTDEDKASGVSRVTGNDSILRVYDQVENVVRKSHIIDSRDARRAIVAAIDENRDADGLRATVEIDRSQASDFIEGKIDDIYYSVRTLWDSEYIGSIDISIMSVDDALGNALRDYEREVDGIKTAAAADPVDDYASVLSS